MIVGGQSRGWVKTVFHFSRICIRIRHNQGSRGLAILLKANLLLLQRLAAKNIVNNPREAGVAVSVTGSGVPRWIPIPHRKRLLRGEISVFRFYFGLLSLYRALDYRGKLSLSTIYDPGVTIAPAVMGEFQGFLNTFLANLLQFGVKPYIGVRDREDSAYWGQPNGLRGARRLVLLAARRVWSFTSGPNSKYSKVLSIGNAWVDAIAIHSRPWLWGLLELFHSFTGSQPMADLTWSEDLVKTSDDWSRICHEAQSKDGKIPNWKVTDPWAGEAQYDVGALSVIEEPGKKRIVAMVDIWTQWALYPLHRFIFDHILGKIPQDGTFDQQKPIGLLLKSAKEDGRTHFWSFDLSAATDRLPVVFQVAVLGAFTHLGYASAWRELLVDRWYRTPREYATTFGGSAARVKYAVGQPMGAYSSWGMLAITHHALVQYCAYKVGHVSWFKWYAVLGDDVVIADRAVADEYVRVMGIIGVKIGFHKSIISSNTTLEFAKRFYIRGIEASPLSLSGIAVGWLGPGFIPEVLSACEARLGIRISMYQVARYMGIGFRAASGVSNKVLWAMPKILTSALLLLLRPGAPRGAVSLYDWYTAITFDGGARGKVRDSREELFFKAIWTEALDSILAPALKRVKTATTKLIYPYKGRGKPDLEKSRQIHGLGQAFVREYHVWFDGLVVPAFLRRFRLAIDQGGDYLREARKVWDKEGNLRKALALIDKGLSQLALVPLEVGLLRREEKKESDKISSAQLEGVILPRSVKRWKKVAPFVDRKGQRSQKRRAYSKQLPFATRVIK